MHQSGIFLLVIEGKRGLSGINPGLDISPDLQSDNRGDLRVLVSRAIGNGSADKCDKGPAPAAFGGVPGVNPPLFGPGQQVTDAIQDMECRFLNYSDPSVACTRDHLGNYSYVSPCGQPGQPACSIFEQFCYQVPLSAAFPLGDTTVAIELVDEAGNVGPKKEIVIRVQP